ncbi:zinc finger protein 595-like [Ochlerotatus camptorhynchus]|uniref:zinc finger protein 595-like n=1 Tax=Ochlerotatus camptorhynchus TaxID=644619 RepID=UPI0031E41FC0
MPCCIDRCPSGRFVLVKFPLSRTIRTRWRDAIKAGTGAIPQALKDLNHLAANDDELHICFDHFPYPHNGGYQDPTVFVNRIGQRVNLDCCRLCQRFESTSQMYRLDGSFSGQSLYGAILQTIKIRLKPEEDPRFLSICSECLVKVDLVRAIQNQFFMMEARHKNILRLQTPLELVEPIEPLDSILVIVEGIKEESEEVYSKQEDNLQDLPKEAIVEEETMLLEMSNEAVVDKPSEPVRERKRVITKTKKLKALKRAAKPDIAVSQPTTPKKRSVVKRKLKEKVQKMSPSNKFPLRTIAAKTCYICPIELADMDHLIAHLAEEHAGKVDYICPHCDGKQLKTIQSYNEHLSFHDSSIRPLQCNFCTLRYCTRRAVEVHETQAHGAPDKHLPQKKRLRNIQCEQCGKVFGSIASAAEHKLVVHENEKAIECKICHKKLGYRNSLHRHMLTHTGEQPYKCDTCGLRFKIITDLNKHIQGDHQGEMPYYCNKCNIPLKDKSTYYRHRTQHKLKIKGPTIRLWKCALCSTVSNISQDLQAHIDEHHSKEDYPYTQCPFCPEKFLSPSQMQMHKYYKHCDQRTSRSTKLQCVICDEQQSSRGQLDTHMVKVHGTEKKYACKLCNSRFANRANLSRHQSLHKEVKKFNCEFCAKTFHQKGAMENHRRNIHTGEKAFLCQTCGKGFKETSTYYRHRATCVENQDGE